jgi:hypothetical protein
MAYSTTSIRTDCEEEKSNDEQLLSTEKSRNRRDDGLGDGRGKEVGRPCPERFD